jgi:ribosome maturation factor RimP
LLAKNLLNFKSFRAHTHCFGPEKARWASAHFLFAQPNRYMGAIAGVVEPAVAGLGFELVDTQVSSRGRMVRVFIDKPGGVSVEDCADVSHHLTRVFAVEGIDFDRLEVSSPGLDRPLRKSADFARFVGQRVDVRMRTPDASGRRRFVGTLQGTAGEVVTIVVDGQTVELSLAGMERARLVPDL